MSSILLLPAHADTIDRIAVSIGNRVITTSDIERQIRVAAFLSGAQPDFSPQTRRQTADRIVDQKLVESELETARYPEPSPQELDAAFAGFKSKFYPDPARYQAALAAAGVTEDEVKEELHRLRRWNGFVTMRFRPTSSVTERDIADYFEKAVAPAARAANPAGPVTLDEFRDRIAEKLIGEDIDKQTLAWLKGARDRAVIVFHEEAFQ